MSSNGNGYPPGAGNANGVDPAHLPVAGQYRLHAMRSAPIAQNTCGCGQLAAAATVGPFLRFQGYQPISRSWRGSVLYVCKADVCDQPELTLLDGRESVINGEVLYTYGDWRIFRYDVSIAVTAQQKQITYWLTPENERHTFFVAGEQEQWHWGFYSCNGFSNDISLEEQADHWHGLEPLWEDVMELHAAKPFHAMVGGGDQLYNDDVFQVKSLKAWKDVCKNDKEARNRYPFNTDMAEDLEGYYFHHYCSHFSHGLFGKALASIPQVMTWDDHDIFDGFGSYPTGLQGCDVFQGSFAVARKYYLLFQHHTTVDRAYTQAGLFGGTVFSNLVLFGPRVAVYLPDQRAERSQNQVMAMTTHMHDTLKLSELPTSVRHLVVVLTVPIVYPHLAGGESILSAFGSANKNGCMRGMFRVTGVSHLLMSQFDEPELLDDLRDHWTGPAHIDERRFFIQHLQMIANSKDLRVTFISGDVHLAAVGKLYNSKLKKKPQYDPRLMYQVVSSGIGNAPPPDGLVSLLNLFAGKQKTDSKTKHKMLKAFSDGRKKFKLHNARNWCNIEELNAVGMEGSLLFQLRVEEEPDAHEPRITPFDTVVPTLIKDSRAKAKKFFDAYGV